MPRKKRHCQIWLNFKRGVFRLDVASYGLSKIIDLENKGVTMDEIYALSKIIDLKKMSREWNPPSPGPLGDTGQNTNYLVSPTPTNGLGQGNNPDLEFIYKVIEMGQPKEKTTGN